MPGTIGGALGGVVQGIGGAIGNIVKASAKIFGFASGEIGTAPALAMNR